MVVLKKNRNTPSLDGFFGKLNDVLGFMSPEMKGRKDSYFPIQNFEKILSSKSSVVTAPVISPR